MNEQLSLSIKAPIFAATVLMGLLLVAVVVLNLDGQFGDSHDTVATQELRYLAEIGYYEPPNGLEDVCRVKYEFWVQIKESIISANNDLISFVSILDEYGHLNVDNKDLVPEADFFFQIVGPMESARIESEQCGKGYFKLSSNAN